MSAATISIRNSSRLPTRSSDFRAVEQWCKTILGAPGVAAAIPVASCFHTPWQCPSQLSSAAGQPGEQHDREEQNQQHLDPEDEQVEEMDAVS
jgi:hypothetical protein